MAIANLLDTKTIPLNDIFSNGKIYHVPIFQRDYSWDEENWEDLWNDILVSRTTQLPHYMGAIVIQTKGDKNYTIIDGQQRFTTISLLALSIIKKLKDLSASGYDTTDNDERVELLMAQFLGQKDPASLKYSPRLFLNENNNGFFHQRLLQFGTPISYVKLSDSEKLLWDAFEYFNKKINEYFSNEKNGEIISSFLTKHIAESLLFIQITVEDEINAYTVFETLNSRGVELTSTDLLKNYLFSIVKSGESDLNIVRHQWKMIVDIVGLKEFPTFLRYYLNTRLPLIEKENLFKKIKQIVTDPKGVFELLDELEKYGYLYAALSTPHDDYWKGDKDLVDGIRELKLFRITQCKPLLMIAYTMLGMEEFKKILRDLVVISFRYNVIGKLNNKEQEKVYNEVCIEIFNKNMLSASAVFNGLKKVYIDDETFKNTFKTKLVNTNSNKKLARYILYKLEGQYANGHKYDYEIDEGTIEHILPENAKDTWLSIFQVEEIEKFIYRLGNLTLIELKKNKEAGDKDFSEKKEIYKDSKYAITSSISTNEWNQRAIAQRQEKMSTIASGIWKVQY
jgi:uncharacterized protein with ParB-like and HNH nuclease domain